MTLKTTTGKYAIAIDGSIKPEKVAPLAELGLAQGVLYRGVFAETRELTGAKRKLEDSAPFDSEKGTKLKDAIAKALADYGTFDVTVTEYVGGGEKSLVYRDARNLLERKESDPKIADLGEWLKEFCGYTGDTHTPDGEDYAQAALVAVNAEIKKRLAAL